ncbi:hypothetical protein HPDP_00752 [Candidatus Hepatincola sp. Pdp]
MVKRIVCPNCSYVQELNSTDNDSLRVCPSCQHQWLSMQNSAYQNKKNIKVITKTANHYKYTISRYKDKNSTYPFFVMDNNYVEFSAPRKIRQFKQSDLISTRVKPQINLNQELKNQFFPQDSSVINEEDPLPFQKDIPNATTNFVGIAKNERVIEKTEILGKEKVDKKENLLETSTKEQVSTLDRIKAFFGFSKKKLLPSSPLTEVGDKLNATKYKTLNKIATQELGTLTKFYNQEPDDQYEVPKLYIPNKQAKFNDGDVFSLKQRHNTGFNNNVEAEVEKRQVALRRAKERELQKLPHNNINIRESGSNREVTNNTNEVQRTPRIIVDPLVANTANNFRESIKKDKESTTNTNTNNYQNLLRKANNQETQGNNQIFNADDLSSPLNNKDLVNIVAKERIIANNKESKLQQLSLIKNSKLVHETKHKEDNKENSLGNEYSLPSNSRAVDFAKEPLVQVPSNHLKATPIRIKRSLSDSYHDDNLPEIDAKIVKDINQDFSFNQEIKDSKALSSRNRTFATSSNKNNTILSLQEQTFAGKFLQEEELTQSIIPTEAKGFFYEEKDSNILNNNLKIENDMRTVEKNSRQTAKIKELDTLKSKEKQELPHREDLLNQRRDSLKAVGVSRDRHDVIFTNNEDGGVFYEEFLEDKETVASTKRNNQEEVLSRQEKRKSLLARRQERTTKIRDNISKQDTINNDSNVVENEYSRDKYESKATKHSDSKEEPRSLVDSQDYVQPLEKSNNINLHHNDYKESRPFNLKEKMQEFSKEKARQSQDSTQPLPQQEISLTDLMSPEPYSTKDSPEDVTTTNQKIDSYQEINQQNTSLIEQNIKDNLKKIDSNQQQINKSFIENESIGQQKLNNEPILSKDSVALLKKKDDDGNNIELPNIQDSEREKFSDSISDSQELPNELPTPSTTQQFSAKQFLLQKIEEGDKEYLDFLNKKIDTLKSEDIKQALMSKTQEIAKQEQQHSLNQEEKLLGASNYTSTDLATDMQKKMNRLKTPKGYIILVIIAILVLAVFYFFSASYMSLKKGEQLNKQTVEGIPAIDDKAVADYTVPHGKQTGMKGATLGNDNKVAIEVNKDKTNSLEVMKVDREKLDSKKSLEQDIQNKIVQENKNAEGSSIGAKFSKSILQTKQSVTNFFNTVKVYKVNSFWETSNHSPQFKTVVTLYNSSTTKSYKVQEMELIFVNASGKKLSTRKITPNKVIRAGEFVRINIIFHETSKVTANAYVFVKQAIAQ